MRNFILILLVFLSTVYLHGQENPPSETIKKYKHGIGAGLGFTTGYGLSYRFMPAKFGAQVNFAPFKNDQTERYSLGVTLLYKLIEGNITSLFLYQGNHFYYLSEMRYEYAPVKDPNAPTVEPEMKRFTESYLNNGLGIGIEFIIAKRIGLNIMGGYAGYRNFKQINFTGEAALLFKF